MIFTKFLPGKEVVVPEHEIKTRAREERMGKAKESRYLLQAGSFKTAKEAEQQRAKLALMGIESKMEKAKVGETYWYRVKLGPFEKIASVNDIQARLKKNSVDVIVTEISNKKSPPATTH
ncbi:SPOR domain-containing protein [Methylocucumis oryzae]|uniref:SPOR domain-containing protein n=1 Tax=Methylocucumis oryzae TaxID=1632867 RepID=UPI001EF9D251|nr:SPOR domain-containing protein [Methylocucumis oryzae]